MIHGMFEVSPHPSTAMTSPRVDTLLLDLARFVANAANGALGPIPESELAAVRELNARCSAVDVSLIEPVLTLSTAHVTEEDDENIRNGLCPPTALISQSGDYGYSLVVTQDEPAKDAPRPGVEAVIEYARLIGCSRIRFDSDADTADLPVFTW